MLSSARLIRRAYGGDGGGVWAGVPVKFTEHLTGKVMTTAEWRATHAACLADGETFTREPFQHPSGSWFWLVCICGAKHLCDVDDEGDDGRRQTH